MFRQIYKSARTPEVVQTDRLHKSLNFLNGDKLLIKANINYENKHFKADDIMTNDYMNRYSITSPDLTSFTSQLKTVAEADVTCTYPALDECTMLFDKYDFEISSYVELHQYLPVLLTQQHEAILQPIVGDMDDLEMEFDVPTCFPDWGSSSDHDDIKRGLLWIVVAIRLNDYVSPHGKNTAMLEYLSEAIDQPGQPGCIAGWNKIAETLRGDNQMMPKVSGNSNDFATGSPCEPPGEDQATSKNTKASQDDPFT